MSVELAPIILFVYNRLDHTRQTVEALQKNELVSESTLYVFADGAKDNATNEQRQKVQDVRDYIHTISGFKEIVIEESSKNKGLANAVIAGVTKVINQYGKVIVLEDDIETSVGFLKYMNDALSLYEEEPQVMHVSGYMYPNDKKLPDTFFYQAASCWGWATWKRSWEKFSPNAKYLFEELKKNSLIETLNINTIHDFEGQLNANIDGGMKTWFIKWHASVVLNHGYCLYPRQSLVNNIGFDNSGEHCGEAPEFYNKYLERYIQVERQPLEFNEIVVQYLKNFYSENRSLDNCTKKKILIIKNMQNIGKKIKNRIKRKAIRIFDKKVRKSLLRSFPGAQVLKNWDAVGFISSSERDNGIGAHVQLYGPYHISNSLIGDYTYIAMNPYMSQTTVGKFCSIGPNLICGWGIHPTESISSHPMFFSTLKQNGMTLSAEDKFEERKPITIGNDVFIGANVTILDGVTIGDGAVIGAGAVVSKDIPPYAVAVGCPIRVIRYRFEEETRRKLHEIRWWDFDEEHLQDVERMIFDVEGFIDKYSK